MRYQLIRSDRQTIGLEVKAGKVIVRAPRKARKRDIDAFVRKNKAWICQKLKEFPKEMHERCFTQAEIDDLSARARVIIPQRVRSYAAMLGVEYNRITIRHQKTRWGSCSGRKNLNFNCLLLLVPQEVMDYVILHELCHLKHMNHSKDFYNDLYLVCPTYKRYEHWLKQNGASLIRRLPHK